MEQKNEVPLPRSSEYNPTRVDITTSASRQPLADGPVNEKDLRAYRTQLRCFFASQERFSDDLSPGRHDVRGVSLMTDEGQQLLRLVLCRNSTGGRVSVDLESYLVFNSDIDHGLQQLVDRWSDFMTPDAVRMDDEALRA